MASYPRGPPAAYNPDTQHTYNAKGYEEKTTPLPGSQSPPGEYDVQTGETGQLQRKLKGRHMQMIAIGGAIGAGLFVGSGGAFSSGGPGSVVICFIIIGIMIMFTMQALAELGVMFPVNGAFFAYAVRFISPSWGFATGWDYAIQWLTVLPFELTAAGLTIQFWKNARDINIGVWITVFLVALALVQIFGVRGYGEVEFVLSIIKITAVTGFIILAIVIDVGGVPTDDRGYIGARYWHDPGAFRHGFAGFCSVFVTAAFSFAGTELTGLAAAEAANPVDSIPRAVKQVVWRISIFYIVSLFMVGLIVPSDSKKLLNAGAGETENAPFVLAITLAGIKGLPSVMNVVITISVLSVANSCAFGSTRTMQALAAEGMGPKFLAYVDKHGRPIWCVIIQLAFGLLAFANEANDGTVLFTWLLALSGIGDFFIWGTICASHIRFRQAWKYNGRTLDELPYRATFGVMGSWAGLFLNVICLMASFYTSVYGAINSDTPRAGAYSFFANYLAGPLIVALWLFWKVWARDWRLLTPISEIDVVTGTRMNIEELQQYAEEKRMEKAKQNWFWRIIHTLF